MLVTLTAIGWITAPHVGIGTGLVGVLRTAGMLWLVAHHVGFTVRGAGHIGLLPLGLVLLPGVLLAMAGRWVVRAGEVTRLRHVGYAAPPSKADLQKLDKLAHPSAGGSGR